MEVKMMVAIEVAMAILMDRSTDTPRWLRMAVMKGTMIMPPPMPNKPAKNPVQRPKRASCAIKTGSIIFVGAWIEKGVCECRRTVILNRGFRWARSASLRVHLTRDALT